MRGRRSHFHSVSKTSTVASERGLAAVPTRLSTPTNHLNERGEKFRSFQTKTKSSFLLSPPRDATCLLSLIAVGPPRATAVVGRIFILVHTLVCAMCSDEELLSILRGKLRREQLTAGVDALMAAADVLAKKRATASHFGNGGDVATLLSEAKLRKENRRKDGSVESRRVVHSAVSRRICVAYVAWRSRAGACSIESSGCGSVFGPEETTWGSTRKGSFLVCLFVCFCGWRKPFRFDAAAGWEAGYSSPYTSTHKQIYIYIVFFTDVDLPRGYSIICVQLSFRTLNLYNSPMRENGGGTRRKKRCNPQKTCFNSPKQNHNKLGCASHLQPTVTTGRHTPAQAGPRAPTSRLRPGVRRRTSRRGRPRGRLVWRPRRLRRHQAAAQENQVDFHPRGETWPRPFQGACVRRKKI